MTTRRAAGGACLAVCWAAFSMAAGQGALEMASQDEIAARLKADAPALLRGDPAALARAEMDVSDLDFQGLVLIAAPSWRPRAALPAVLLHQKSALRGWEVPEEDNLLLAAFEPASGTLRVAHLLRDEKSIEHPPPELTPPPRPAEDQRLTIMTKAYHFDAGERLDLPPSVAGAIVLRALAFDWVSDAAIVRVEEAGRPTAAAAAQVLPAGSTGRFPSYECGAKNPPMPTEGVALRLAELEDGGTALFGSFALRVTNEAGGIRPAAGVLPAGLLVLGLERSRPAASTLGLTASAPAASAGGQRIEGCFAFDLRQFAATTGCGRRAVYLFVADRVYGPVVTDSWPRQSDD